MNTAIQTVDAEDRRDVVATPMEMLAQAVSNGANPDTLSKLMDLAERYEAAQARRAFDAAVAEAKAEIKPVIKNKRGHSGKYASFDAYAAVVDPVITKYGLSYRFETTQDERIHVTCVLSHRDGHSARNTLAGPPDNSGSKNNIQAIGSTLTYLQRYSLIQALGLSATEDDDGEGAGKVNPEPVITEEQAGVIHDLLAATNVDRKQFLTWACAASVEGIPARNYEHIVGALRKKLPEGGDA